MEAITTIERNGYKAEMFYMEYFESYRETGDTFGTIYSTQRDYNPDGHQIEELEAIIDPQGTGDYDFSKLDKDYIWLPVDIYEHSGLTVCVMDKESFSYYLKHQPNRSYFGIIAVPKESVRSCYRCWRITQNIRKRAESVLRGEIDDLDLEYQGLVMEYVITDPNGGVVEAIGHYLNEEVCERDMVDALNNVVEMTEVDEEEKQIAMICGTL